jgi:hypothetical protein
VAPCANSSAHAQDPTAPCLTLVLIDRGSRAEVQSELFARLTFQAPHPLRMTRSEFAHEAFDRFVGIREPLFIDQVLVNPLCMGKRRWRLLAFPSAVVGVSFLDVAWAHLSELRRILNGELMKIFFTRRSKTYR